MKKPYHHDYHSGYPSKPSKEHCERHVDHEVQITTTDGYTYHAILIDVDIHNITILVPEDIDDHYDNMHRQFGYSYMPRYRRYNRLILPLTALTALSLLPIAAYPYPHYPYPYF